MELKCPKCDSNKIFKPTKIQESLDSRRTIGLNINNTKRRKQYDYRCINCGNEIFL